MIFVEASPRLRLRPSHLLLMLYRYTSGVYQAGDLAALNYLKGFLDATGGASEETRVLTVSGHGIGEAERWFADRIPGCLVDSTSFRMVDTQLLHALRTAQPHEIATLFDRFAVLVAPYPALAALAAEPGLVPYWCEQAALIAAAFATGRVNAYSDSPLRIPPARTYGVMYASQCGSYLSLDAAERLRRHLAPGGVLAALSPARDGARFGASEPVADAKALLGELLERHGYPAVPDAKPLADLGAIASRREVFRFSVLAPAATVLTGELILASLAEHISDRRRLEVLDEVAGRFAGLQVPVSEELELCLMEAE